MGSVTTTEERPAQVPALHAESLLSQIVSAASNPEVDATKMEVMTNLALKLQGHEQRQEFARSLAAAMSEMPRISRRNRIVIPAKDGKPAREQGRFASFENIDAVVRPILDRHGLAIRFRIGSDQGVTCTPILSHRNGYEDVGDTMRVPPDTSGSKNAAQAVGSAISYAKRYAMCAALNIVTEGDDRDGTTYPLATDELNDRQQRVVDEAYASHKDGNFAAWWGRQSAKDRELLIVRGIYSELTGAPALPTDRTLDDDTLAELEAERAPETAEEDRKKPPPPPQTSDMGKGREGRTAAQMVDDYIAKVEACLDTESLLKIQEDPKTIAWLNKLAAADPEQHGRATIASSRHYAYLMSKEATAGSGEQGRLID